MGKPRLESVNDVVELVVELFDSWVVVVLLVYGIVQMFLVLLVYVVVKL